MKNEMCVKVLLQDSMGFILTIRQGVEEGCSTKAAITSRGEHPNLHFILSGPAEVCQHSLVSVSFFGVALNLTTTLLPNEKRVS